MKLGSNNSINFQARISDKVYKQIVKQTREYPISHKLRKKLYSQINKLMIQKILLNIYTINMEFLYKFIF